MNFPINMRPWVVVHDNMRARIIGHSNFFSLLLFMLPGLGPVFNLLRSDSLNKTKKLRFLNQISSIIKKVFFFHREN